MRYEDRGWITAQDDGSSARSVIVYQRHEDFLKALVVPDTSGRFVGRQRRVLQNPGIRMSRESVHESKETRQLSSKHHRKKKEGKRFQTKLAYKTSLPVLALKATLFALEVVPPRKLLQQPVAIYIYTIRSGSTLNVTRYILNHMHEDQRSSMQKKSLMSDDEFVTWNLLDLEFHQIPSLRHYESNRVVPPYEYGTRLAYGANVMGVVPDDPLSAMW
ncbi:hypothetical protein BDY19DRAFT_1044133 [Irpex rosettiformis]|uniref:Uncharacterized protein n=1 Tax=Irpex rosettiformis TaxID=378272 RepID=A0ACB8UIL5_9APHY|nr:hypothetical protein BDY19DRAFT_1044133 [Irpex rosettiformis]